MAGCYQSILKFEINILTYLRSFCENQEDWIKATVRLDFLKNSNYINKIFISDGEVFLKKQQRWLVFRKLNWALRHEIIHLESFLVSTQIQSSLANFILKREWRPFKKLFYTIQI